MNFSNQLMDKLKKELGIEKEKEAAEIVPNMNKQNLSDIRHGKRHLTEEQAIYIAETCKLDCALVLVELAAECAKTEKAQSAWNELAKKLKAAAISLVVAAILSVSGVSGVNQNQRIKYSP